MDIGERIKVLRKKSGLTQIEVAEKMETSQSNYGMLENGKTELTYSKMLKLAEVFGVSVGELLGLEANGEQASKIEALERELEAMKSEKEWFEDKVFLLEKLNVKFEEQNDWIYDAIRSYIDYVVSEVQESPEITFLQMPLEVNHIEAVEQDSGGVQGWNYIYLDVSMPPNELKMDLVKVNEYALCNIFDVRLYHFFIYENKHLRFFFEKNLVKDTQWKENYKEYQKNKPSTKKLALLKAYQQKANELYAKYKTDIVIERQVQLKSAWEYAQQVVNNQDDIPF